MLKPMLLRRLSNSQSNDYSWVKIGVKTPRYHQNQDNALIDALLNSGSQKKKGRLPGSYSLLRQSLSFSHLFQTRKIHQKKKKKIKTSWFFSLPKIHGSVNTLRLPLHGSIPWIWGLRGMDVALWLLSIPFFFKASSSFYLAFSCLNNMIYCFI